MEIKFFYFACNGGRKHFDVIENFVRAQPMSQNPFIQLEVAAIVYFVALMFYKKRHGG